MWTYHQSTGKLLRDGLYVATGYAGAGLTKDKGRNNPAMEGVVAKGPIPRGRWKIGEQYTHRNLGPICMNLEPYGHRALGRTLFRIHGNSKDNDASKGCIILDRATRLLISRSGDIDLEVVL